MTTTAMPKVAIDGRQEDWDLVPQHLQSGLQQYLDHGHVPGGFLQACLSNDLTQAVGRAGRGEGGITIEQLRAIVQFLYNCAPTESWGSEERMDAWAKNPTRVRLAEQRMHSEVER